MMSEHNTEQDTVERHARKRATLMSTVLVSALSRQGSQKTHHGL